MGLIFPNLSAAALSSIPREQIGYGGSLYSMTRNIGASIGTSVLTTMLVHREQVQQSHLVQHLSVFRCVADEQRACVDAGGGSISTTWANGEPGKSRASR